MKKGQYIDLINKGSYLIWYDDAICGKRSGYVKDVTINVYENKVYAECYIKLDKDCRFTDEKYVYLKMTKTSIKKINLEIH